MEKNSLVYSLVPSQLNHTIKSSWIKHSWFYSNHENHENSSPRKFPAIQYGITSRDWEKSRGEIKGRIKNVGRGGGRLRWRRDRGGGEGRMRMKRESLYIGVYTYPSVERYSEFSFSRLASIMMWSQYIHLILVIIRGIVNRT